MESWLVVIILAVVLILVIPLIIVSISKSQRRWKQIKAALEQQGYAISDGPRDMDKLNPFAISQLGNYGNITSSINFRMSGALVNLFDYMSGMLRRGNVNDVHTQTALLFESERLDLPALLLRPKKLANKLKATTDQQDIDLKRHPAFSNAYALQGSDEGRIQALFTDKMLDFFAQRPELCVEGQGQQLLIYQLHKVVSAKDYSNFLEEGQAIYNLMANNKTPSSMT